MSVGVLIVDDHNLVRAGLRALLEQMDDVEVMGEAADGRTAVEMVAEMQPGVVLMDLAMPELNGLSATRRILDRVPETKVIMLSVHAGEELVIDALRAGAQGYLLKDAATLELELAIKSVARGEVYLSPRISRQVIQDYLARVEKGDERVELLTDRQREVLQLIVEGRTSREAARILNLSAKTVEAHRAQIMERLDIHDLPGLVRYAIRTGLVSSER